MIPKSLETLEHQRINISNQIAALGDLRGVRRQLDHPADDN